MKKRKAKVNRRTKETDILVRLDIDGSGQVDVSTGIGFLDHMLSTLGYHSHLDLEIKCRGDLQVDDHHTSEDCALALGQAVNQALGDKSGILRFGSAFAPMDEALARAVVDLSGRPYSFVQLDLAQKRLGAWAAENIGHFFQSLANALSAGLHVDLIRGDNDHHKVEAAFKAMALSLRQAWTRFGSKEIPSLKGKL